MDQKYKLTIERESHCGEAFTVRVISQNHQDLGAGGWLWTQDKENRVWDLRTGRRWKDEEDVGRVAMWEVHVPRFMKAVSVR
jgi:hypothetical protein